MRFIAFIISAMLTTAGGAIVLTGSNVPHPQSFSIPLPSGITKPANTTPADMQKRAGIDLNLIEVDPERLTNTNAIPAGLINEKPATDAPLISTPNISGIKTSTSDLINDPAQATTAKVVDLPTNAQIPSTTPVANQPVDLDELWTNSSLKTLLNRSSDFAQTSTQHAPALPKVMPYQLEKVTDNLATTMQPGQAIDSGSISGLSEQLEGQINKQSPDIKELLSPTVPEKTDSVAAVDHPEANHNLVKLDKPVELEQIQKPLTRHEKFDSLVSNLMDQQKQKQNPQIAVAPKTEPVKEQTPVITESVPNTTDHIARQAPTPQPEIKQQVAKPQIPIHTVGTPKRMTYVTWKKGYLTTDRRPFEFQNTGSGKTKVLMLGSFSGRDVRNPPLMDRLLNRLTDNKQLNQLASYLLVRSPNPDGQVYSLPGNIRGVDLAKNFSLPQSQIVSKNGNMNSPSMPQDNIEIETRIIMHLIREYKPELMIQVRLAPETSIGTIEYPSRLETKLRPFIERNSLRGVDLGQAPVGSFHHYVKSIQGADTMTVHIPDTGNVDQDWLNARIWLTELLHLSVSQEKIQNELVATEVDKFGPQASDEMVSYGSITPLTPPDPTKLQGEVEFLPSPPGKNNIAKISTLEEGFVELPPPPRKNQ
jgi:hypothetical protein